MICTRWCGETLYDFSVLGKDTIAHGLEPHLWETGEA
jgi:hypothetical protein